MVLDPLEQELIQSATDVRKKAYAPFSKYSVGAALRADDGAIYVGANVENSSYGLTICAERSAITAAVSAGARRIEMLAVMSGSTILARPCGACLQVIAEFAVDDLPIILLSSNASWERVVLTDLLGRPFRSAHLR